MYEKDGMATGRLLRGGYEGNEYILSKPYILDEITDRLVREKMASKVILFGSRARGDAHERSDIDIAVEAGDTVSDLCSGGNIDIVDLRQADRGLRDVIARDGMVLYERKG
jgi:CRISPR-associated protein Cmr1